MCYINPALLKQEEGGGGVGRDLFKGYRIFFGAAKVFHDWPVTLDLLLFVTF